MKRCCETCRFFDKGTLAGSGWCRHPERVEAQSDLVLVRASQLTCRKGWDKDFWEPIAPSNRTVDRFNRGPQLGPVPPASPEDIDAIIKAGRASDEERAAATAAVEEDRVVGAAPSPLTHVPKSLITKRLPPAPEIAQEAPGADEGPNSREQILIAKEEVARKRISNRIRPTFEPLPSPIAASVPPAGSGHDSAEAAAGASAEPPPHRDQIDDSVVGNNIDAVDVAPPVAREDPPFVPGEAWSEETDVDDEPLVPSIPPLWNDSTNRPLRYLWLVPTGNPKPTQELQPEEDNTNVPGGDGEDVVVRSDRTSGDRPFELPPPVDATFTPPARPAREKKRSRKQWQSSPFRSRWTDARERPNRLEPTPPPTWADAPDWGDGEPWADDHDWADEAPLPADAVLPALDGHEAGVPLPHVELPSYSDAGVLRPSPSTGEDTGGWAVLDLDSEPSMEFEPAEAFEDVEVQTVGGWGVQEDTYGYGFDDVVLGDSGIGPIHYDPEIDEYVLAPEVPRMCRTCAAFRPADDGERGWCSNGWAFNNRLLVSAWDVPCQTSFGNWWIPSDDHWNDGLLERLHAPAPRFDQLMAQRLPSRRERQNPKKRWS